MSIPLHDLPELRATFLKDSRGLLETVAKQLASLAQSAPDFSAIPLLRNAVHSLRGAAAMVGAEKLTSLVIDYERLIEVADSFKLTAPERARQVYLFLQAELARIEKAIQATVDGRIEDASQCYDAVHSGALASWGDYFYASLPDNKKIEKTVSKPAPKAARVGPKNGNESSDADKIARDFLKSLESEGKGRSTSPANVTPAPTAAATSVPEAVAAVPAEQIDPEMLNYFVLETTESLAQVENLILVWEKTPDDAKVAFSIFRLVHTVKGAANSLGLNRIGRLLHSLEDLLETQVVDRAFTHVTELVEIILGVADTVRALVREAESGTLDAVATTRIASLDQRIKILAGLELAPLRAQATEAAVLAPAQDVISTIIPVLPALEPVSQPAAPLEETAMVTPIAEAPIQPPVAQAEKTSWSEKAESPHHQTIRVESGRLDLLMNLIGELVISRSRIEKKLGDIARLKEEMFFGKTRLFQAINEFQERYEYSRPRFERNRITPSNVNSNELLPRTGREIHPPATPGQLSGFSDLEFDQYDEFNILARTLMEIGTDTGEIFAQLTRLFDAFGEETDQFNKITTRLQDEITHVRMIPLTLLFQRLKRSSRDAARKENKEINFVTQDNDARLDKLIVDQLYTPLLHIVRNAVSHGIEAKEERAASGKSEVGEIQLRAVCEANQIVIELADDGRGLDFNAIRETAIQRGLLASNAVITNEDLTSFIFQPGFTTASNVTDVSGRGVGLDVVRQEIARLGGTVHVRSVKGTGCTFVIHLPLTLAINQAMFVGAGDQIFALPLNFIERVQDRQLKDITVSGQQELVQTPEGVVPFIRLGRILNLPDDKDGGAIVMARVADRRVAIGVDHILRKQNIVVKPLGPLLQTHPLFSGATLEGDGKVVMIVDLPRVFDTDWSTDFDAGSDVADGDLPSTMSQSIRPTILVVDDSLSVRKVIEKHLHSLQFNVVLAVDGLDALEKLRTNQISLVLTDLEMPRMHGFELIAEMRRHEVSRRIPIIVVTSRDAEKHRVRATSLGANDYIIKPFSRDQLAEYIQRHLASASAK